MMRQVFSPRIVIAEKHRDNGDAEGLKPFFLVPNFMSICSSRFGSSGAPMVSTKSMPYRRRLKMALSSSHS